MATKKAGTILINLENKKIALVYSREHKYGFPKGHLEKNESLQECAIRETEEETLRALHLLSDKEVGILKYTTPSGEDVEVYIYLAIDDGPTSKIIAEEDKETFEWFDLNDVEKTLSFDNLKEFWKNIKGMIEEDLLK